MALKSSFQVLGMPSVTALLVAQQRKVTTGIKDSMRDAKLLLETEAEASIKGQRAEHRSVDTGEFVRSVDSQITKNSVTIVSQVPQARIMEFGTSTLTPRRHFGNTMARNKGNLIKIVEDNITL